MGTHREKMLLLNSTQEQRKREFTFGNEIWVFKALSWLVSWIWWSSFLEVKRQAEYQVGVVPSHRSQLPPGSTVLGQVLNSVLLCVILCKSNA